MMWTPSMFVPFNIPTRELVTFVLVAAAAQLALVALLAATLLWHPTEGAWPDARSLAHGVGTSETPGPSPGVGATVG